MFLLRIRYSSSASSRSCLNHSSWFFGGGRGIFFLGLLDEGEEFGEEFGILRLLLLEVASTIPPGFLEEDEEFSFLGCLMRVSKCDFFDQGQMESKLNLILSLSNFDFFDFYKLEPHPGEDASQSISLHPS